GAVAVYEPLGRAGEPLPDFAAAYAVALTHYVRKEFRQALDGFLAVDAKRGGDPPSRVLAGRCRSWLATPPPPDWDGVFVPEGK
ncbi:MAG: adenylate/guanylate cyclase domain-containing protein, partial [Acidobacteriota bacterium]